MKKINCIALLKTQIKAGANLTQAVELVAFTLKDSGNRKAFRSKNEFLDNCLGCAESFAVNIDLSFSLEKEQRKSILAAMGFDFNKRNCLMR